MEMASSSSSRKRPREDDEIQEDDPMTEGDVTMKDSIPGDQRTPLQVLMDEAKRSLPLHDENVMHYDLIYNKDDIRKDFVIDMYDLICASDTFMETMKGILEPYPELLTSLNNFMPGYMNVTVNDDTQQTVTTWKNFKPFNKRPVCQILHPVKIFLDMVRFPKNVNFRNEIIEKLSDLLSSRIDADTFMAFMKSKNLASDSSILGYLNKVIPGYIEKFKFTILNDDGSDYELSSVYRWLE